ncbi:hypothetical protein ONS95_004336 [Cadophora gregata]|uniref:uncharacterized protein n=1 Tax=Cadophora gregata TaxID=51156 RepID=UPI0026DB7118|nr:uncharacterized protein ONS95_004336 [Cadophora gregata]KAK0105279.1 hypothetical protein ONS96_004675 [Cadophora gregata f. sp. sojae]KAK0105820.1 hypothetical protein ONS95_004336 [Cadophora gregata]
MGAFGSMSMGNKFGIVLACLIGAAFIAGFIKLAWNKRKLRKNTKKAELEASLRSDKEKLVTRGVGEGDLFGVRAIEHGYFGGVSQSRPTSPTPSYILAPETKLMDWGKAGYQGGHSASSSMLSLPQSLAPSSLNHTKRKPSPLSLQPSSAELNGRISHSPSGVGGIGGSYIPPLPSPRSHKSFKSVSPTTGTFEETEAPTWVSPLDVHFSRPSTPKERPTSYLPKLQFPGEIEKIGLFVPSPSNSVRHVKSETASIVSTNASSIKAPPPVRQPSRGPRTPLFSVFPPVAHPMPSRAARAGSRSIFPTNDDHDRPSSRRGPRDGIGNSSPRAVPLNDLTPQIVATEHGDFPQDTRHWSPTSPVQSTVPPEQWDPTSPTFPGPIYCNDGLKPLEPIIRDSVVTVQRVSIFQPSHARESSAIAVKSRSRGHSIAASSMYSTRTSILEFNKDPLPSQHSRTRSSSISALPNAGSRSRSRSTSASQKRSASSHSLTRTRDSIRRHSRMPSSDSIRNRRSRDRDQMHYDPTSSNRTREGSVQGRKVDFHHPRESPFSNSNAIHHSPNSSISSVSSRNSSYFDDETETPPIPKIPSKPPQIELPPLDVKPGRGRSESDTSQVSVSDFYDAYYRQSILAQRASATSVVQGVNVGAPRYLGVNMGVQSGNGPVMREVAVRRPAPLRVGATIVEVVTPTPSPLATRERFPSMI